MGVESPEPYPARKVRAALPFAHDLRATQGWPDRRGRRLVCTRLHDGAAERLLDAVTLTCVDPQVRTYQSSKSEIFSYLRT